MGGASQVIIEEWNIEKAVNGLCRAIEYSLDSKKQKLRRYTGLSSMITSGPLLCPLAGRLEKNCISKDIIDRLHHGQQSRYQY